MFFWGSYPVLRISLFFIFGILLGEQLSIPKYIQLLGFAFISAIGSFLVSRTEPFPTRSILLGSLIMMLPAILGMIISKPVKEASTSFHTGKSLYLVEIREEQKSSEKWRKFNSRILGEEPCSFSKPNLNAILFLKKPDTNSYLPGDQFLIRGQLSEIPGPSNPFMFNLKAFYKKKGITHYFFGDTKPQNLPSKKVFSFERQAALARISIDRAFDRRLSSRNKNVLMAMVFGQKNNLEKETIDDFRKAGASHLMAVSGLHMGIVYLLITFLLGHFWKKSWIRPLILIPAMFAYAFLAGLPASALRAATMLSIFEVSELINRKNSAWNSLGISAFFFLLIDPLLIHDLGFQLSYAAMAGIFLFYDSFSKTMISQIPVIGFLWRSISLTLSVILTTTPIILFYFGEFNPYGILTNLFSGILALILMGLFMLALGIKPILSSGFDLICTILDSILDFFLWILSNISAFPHSGIAVLNFDLVFLLLTFGVILVFAGWLQNRSKTLVLVFQLFLLAILTYSTKISFMDPSYQELAIFPLKNGSLISMVSGGQATCFSTIPNISNKEVRWTVEGYFKNRNISDPKYSFPAGTTKSYRLILKDKSILVLKDNPASKFQNEDYIFINSWHGKAMIGELKKCKSQIIIGPDFYRKQELIQQLNHEQISFWDLDSGYFLEYL